MTLTTAPRQAVVVVGLGYGDEGKGATVDALAAAMPDTVAVVRWSSGAQAAHNVRHGSRHHTFNQFGAATFLDVRTMLRAPMVVNPILLAAEADALAEQGVGDPLALVVADARCLVTTPIHIAMNRARELARGAARHGSTGLGVGETVAYDLAVRSRARRGDVVGNFAVHADAPGLPALRLGDLRDRRATVAALDELAAFAAPLLAGIDDPDARHPSVTQLADALCGVAEHVSIVDDIDRMLGAALESGSVLFEGSQGMLLDEWHGFHPHTTWATVTPRHLVAELEAAGSRPTVIGVTRTYATRHGDGPMPTEDASLRFDEPDNREGRYQGGWRTGHLDLPALRYAARVAGRVDGVVVNHLDHLAGGTGAGGAGSIGTGASRVGTGGAGVGSTGGRGGRLELDGTARLQVADTWAGRRDPLGPGFDVTHDLERLERLTAAARAACPDLVPLVGSKGSSTGEAVREDVLRRIEQACGAPVVMTADGPFRVDRQFTGRERRTVTGDLAARALAVSSELADRPAG